MRGGGWYHIPKDLRVSRRAFVSPDSFDHDIGFRCVRAKVK
jgi:formylglycine-generating enzyme required for sulfatase activity